MNINMAIKAPENLGDLYLFALNLKVDVHINSYIQI